MTMQVECTCGEGKCVLCDDRGWQRHIRVSSDPNENWVNDDIQFPRLLSEIYAVVELNDEQWEDLCDSMSLDRDQIVEVFERADATWQGIKQKT